MYLRKKSGFTLIELLVAMSVSILLGVTLLQIFMSSNRTVAEATQKIDLMSRARIPMDRAAYYLSSAIEVPGREQGHFLYPLGLGTTNERGTLIERDKPRTWYHYIVFRTTEDFMNPAFDPSQITDLTHVSNNLNAYRTQAHNVYDYIIWFEDDAFLDKHPDVDKALCLARIQPLLDGSGNIQFRDSTWAAGDPWVDIDTMTGPTRGIRVLAQRCEEISFLPRTSGAMQMASITKGDIQTNNGIKTKEYSLTSLIQIPSLPTRE